MAIMEHQDQAQAGDEMVCWVYMCTPQSIVKRSEGKNSNRAETGRQELM